MADSPTVWRSLAGARSQRLPSGRRGPIRWAPRELGSGYGADDFGAGARGQCSIQHRADVVAKEVNRSVTQQEMGTARMVTAEHDALVAVPIVDQAGEVVG